MMVKGETLLITLITGVLGYVSQKKNRKSLYIRKGSLDKREV